MDKTKIEWAQSTWNPVTGCLHDCRYCYARTIAERFKMRGENVPGAFEMLELYSPYRDASGKKHPYPAGFVPTLHRYRLSEYEKKKGRTIFVCSMADLFGAWVPDRWIKEVFDACEKAPQHRYLFLTKNPQRYLDLALAGKLPARDNMWYGTTATTPSHQFFFGQQFHTFVSIEPILRDFSGEIEDMCDTFAQWVIVGAETGNRKGKVIPKEEWIQPIIQTCIDKNIRLFMKDSLLPVVGEDKMFRELPWNDDSVEHKKREEDYNFSIEVKK